MLEKTANRMIQISNERPLIERKRRRAAVHSMTHTEFLECHETFRTNRAPQSLRSDPAPTMEKLFQRPPATAPEMPGQSAEYVEMLPRDRFWQARQPPLPVVLDAVERALAQSLADPTHVDLEVPRRFRGRQACFQQRHVVRNRAHQRIARGVVGPLRRRQPHRFQRLPFAHRQRASAPAVEVPGRPSPSSGSFTNSRRRASSYSAIGTAATAAGRMIFMAS
jgi:hypothetical protein